MQKIYKKLTARQKEVGIIFASTLSTERTEQVGDTTHAVFFDQDDKNDRIARLLNDKFFNESPYKYNIIRRG